MFKFITLISILFLVVYGIFLFQNKPEAGTIFDKHVSFYELKTEPSAFVGKAIFIKAKVLNSLTILNQSKTTLIDNEGEEFLLMGNTPYQKNQSLSLKVELCILYQDETAQIAFLKEIKDAD